MCNTHEAIIKSLAEELGCKCSDNSELAPETLRHFTHCWFTSKGLKIDVGIIDSEIWLHIQPRSEPIILELSYPQLIEHLKKLLQTYHSLISIRDNVEQS